MNRHELPDPNEDQPAESVQIRVNPAKTIEVKVIVSTAVTLLAAVAYAVLNAVAAAPDILANWSPALRFVTIAALPPLLTFISGYLVPSNRI